MLLFQGIHLNAAAIQRFTPSGLQLISLKKNISVWPPVPRSVPSYEDPFRVYFVHVSLHSQTPPSLLLLLQASPASKEDHTAG